MMELTDDELIHLYYGEYPSRPAALACMVLYIAISFVVLGLTIRTKAWFMLTVVFTGFLEMAGFATRVSMIANPDRLTFIFTQCFLIISPVLLAIVEYICVGKLFHMSEAGKETVFTRWIARAYTVSDLLCLILQGAGGAAMSSTDLATLERGRQLLLAGLFLQLAFFASFTVIALYVHLHPKFGYRDNAKLRPLFWCLYITIVLMFIRNIFRVAEFVQGFRGTLATNEAYFYGFDFVPIFLTFVFFCIFHYGFYLPHAKPTVKDCKTSAVAPQQQMV